MQVFLHREAVGHPGEVVADCTFETTFVEKFLKMRGEHGGLGVEGGEEVGDDAFSLDRHAHYPVVAVKTL